MLNGLNGTNRLLPTFIVSSAVYDEDPTVYDVEETTRELVQDQFVISPFEDTMPRIRWRHPLLAALLICICVLTILGNVLVVTAVCTKKYLRNPTGFLIVSLAFADLVVGLVIMPLNSLFEMTRHVWLLGLPACDLFHAMDILASTASIWNLCVISLDRYMAGKDPIGYRDKVSKKRIIIAIVLVWLMSAFLSFPAIIVWRKSDHLYKNKYLCVFTDNQAYVIFSSLFSFYIPMLLILFAYGRVFLIATRHSNQMKTGIKKMKQKNRRPGDLLDDTAATLRIHFGRARPLGRNSAIASMLISANGTAVSTQRLNNRFRRVGGNADCSGNSLIKSANDFEPKLRQNHSDRCISRDSPIHRPLIQNDHNSMDSRTTTTYRNLKKSASSSMTSSNASGKNKSQDGVPKGDEICETVSEITPMLPPKRENTAITLNRDANNSDVTTNLLPQQTFIKKGGMREKSRQMLKYVHEQRAARTLSIIVGVFLLCWLPFFIVSPFMALCTQCVKNQDIVFSVITWAGHLNSLLNPLIYSRFSREFRRAFKQILTCHREKQKTIKTPLNLMFQQLVSISNVWPPIPQQEPSASPKE
ncbi:G-PROTEIN-RECEP-F1-2 domain-containing protein [Aphelenchoides bicaudatus]|nr:G-PROTEIN-RECEP-F1-2 domain-containing protein [Aphelenchoides bicaudatus]